MLVKPSIEKLLEKVDNRYSLTYVVARRARQLVAGAKPMTQTEAPNLVTLACEEIAEDQVLAVPRIVEPLVPLRPENEAARLQALIEKRERERGLEEDLDFGSTRTPKEKREKEEEVESFISTEEVLASSTVEEEFEEVSMEVLLAEENFEEEE